MQSEDGKIIAHHYTAFFLIISAMVGDILKTGEYKEPFKKALDFFTMEFENYEKSPLSDLEPWAMGYVIRGLVEAGNEDVLTKADTMLLKYIKSKQNKDDGLWADIEDSAQIIIGLLEWYEKLQDKKRADNFKSSILDIIKDSTRGLKFRVDIPCPVHGFNFDNCGRGVEYTDKNVFIDI